MNKENVSTTTIRSTTIKNIVEKAARYATDEVTPMEKEYIMKNSSTPRVPRKDLSVGTTVVVLEGVYTGRRGILIKKLENCISVIFVFSKDGTPQLFKIDERYLLKLSLKVSIPKDMSIDADTLYMSTIEDMQERVDVEGSESELMIMSKVLESVSKVEFLKAYLMADFKVDDNIEFYSQKY